MWLADAVFVTVCHQHHSEIGVRLCAKKDNFVKMHWSFPFSKSNVLRLYAYGGTRVRPGEGHVSHIDTYTWTKKIDGFPFERVASLWPSLSSLKHARPSSAATQKTAVPV